MRIRRRLAPVLAGATWLAVAAASVQGANSPYGRAPGLDNPALRSTQPYVQSGEIIVKFRDRLPQDGAGKASGRPELDALMNRHAVTSIDRLARGRKASAPKPGQPDISRIYSIKYADGTDAMQMAREFSAFPEVEYAEPRFIYQLDLIPNDALYASAQAAYLNTRMKFTLAWDTTQGGSGNAVVAICDGGTDWDHEDLLANVWSNTDEIAGNLIDDDNNGFVDDIRGWNFANNSNDPTGLVATPASATHGTHTAGIGNAVANNTVGIAGASFNAKYMPICAASPTTDNAIAFGYDGIIYAAENDADAVNCSWGGQGGSSAFEQDVINFCYTSGTVVVAAAGNNATTAEHFPSAYANTMAVANVTNTDVRNSSTNYGLWVDVSAQGTSIRSTLNGGGYGNLTGTSMSAPHVAAACALVKTRWPGYSAEQVMQRVRVTSDNIDGVNSSAYKGNLGYGRINAQQAMIKNTPAVSVTSFSYTTPDGDQIIEPGETITINATVTNWLASATGLDFKLRENSVNTTVVDSAAVLASLDSLQSAVLPPFTVSVSPSAPIQHTVLFTLAITTTTPAYTDKSRFELTVLPVFATHDANNIDCSVTSVGKLGFALTAGGTGKDGIGWKFNNSNNFLFEGGLLIGTAAPSVSDGARTTGAAQDDDFQTVTNGIPVVTEPFGPFAEYGVATFTDALAASPIGINVKQESYEMLAPNDDFIILKYRIRNDSGVQRNNLHCGWYCDWDIDGGSFGTNRTGYDAARGMIYVWDDGAGPNEYVGTTTLTPEGTTSARGIYNDQAHPSNPSWGVYDAYTDQEKWETLTAGIVFTSAGPADVSTGIASGPFNLAPGDSCVVAFAFIGGTNLADLQANADQAQDLWDNFPSTTDAGDGLTPRALRLAQNAPNPFNPSTKIAFDLPHSARVKINVYRADGRLVRNLLAETRVAGSHAVVWNGRDNAGRAQASGTYFYRFEVEGGNSITRKMQLLK